MKYDAEKSGQRIKDAREKMGFTQKFVADKIGLTQPTVYQQESGKSKPTPDALIWYSENYHVSVDYLLGLTDKPFYEHKSGNAIYITTSKKPPDVSGGESEPVAEKTFTVNSDELPANRQELEQFVRDLLREVIPDQKTDEQK